MAPRGAVGGPKLRVRRTGGAPLGDPSASLEVVFDRDKGSPLGLMGNRRTFTTLSQRLAGQPQQAAGLEEAAILLSAGERELDVQPATG